jgi:hypothetical protein
MMDYTRQEQGTDVADVTDLVQSPATDALRLNEREEMILKLWDQEEEVRLEISLLKAQSQGVYTVQSQHVDSNFNNATIHSDEDVSELAEDELQSQMANAERELLEARTKYSLRKKIIQNVLIADPVLKAVHAGSSATELETRLLPMINERDVITMVHNDLAKKLYTTNSKLATLERENAAANDRNKDLAQEVLTLANDLKAEKVEEVQDARMRAQLQKLDEEIRKTRREWRVMKSLAASVVAGSGVDWAKNPHLLELVMDEEDEMVG